MLPDIQAHEIQNRLTNWRVVLSSRWSRYDSSLSVHKRHSWSLRFLRNISHNCYTPSLFFSGSRVEFTCGRTFLSRLRVYESRSEVVVNCKEILEIKFWQGFIYVDQFVVLKKSCPFQILEFSFEWHIDFEYLFIYFSDIIWHFMKSYLFPYLYEFLFSDFKFLSELSFPNQCCLHVYKIKSRIIVIVPALTDHLNIFIRADNIVCESLS